MAYPHGAYTEKLDYGNILWVKTKKDMEGVFHELERKQINLETLRCGSEKCARDLLDYRVLAARLYR